MFRKTWIAAVAAAILAVMMLAVPAMADGVRVVTIGQDLSDEQEAFIIKYFGVDLATAQVIYVNNQQERQYVGSWIPLEQIGNITISSAYVQPTNSGGIQVKTANLTYVTGNMIASVLSTAGVKNCNVVAAAPFPVSGTGALTGVMIAYQQATGQALDEGKRDLAVQEFTVTQQAAESIGENEALQLVNAVKMEVIQNAVGENDKDQIEQIVDHVIDEVQQSINIDNSVTTINESTVINNGLSESDRQLIIDLATEIARQDYQYEDVKETLQRVEENLSNETNINIVIDNSDETVISNENRNDNSSENNVSTEVDQDSILSNTNDDLIDASLQSSTREEDIIAIEEAIAQEEPVLEGPEDSIYDMQEEFYEEDPYGYEMPEDVYSYEDPYGEEMPEDVYSYEDPYAEEMPEDVYYYEDPYAEEMPEDVYYYEDPYAEEMPEDVYFEEPYGEDMPEDIGIEEPYGEEAPEDISAEEPVFGETMPGGWSVYTGETEYTLPEDAKAAFDQAIQEYTGMNLIPEVYLGSQIVAGKNYQILCQGAPVVPDPEQGLYVVTVYQDLEGNARITNVADFDLAELEEQETADDIQAVLAAGGWQINDEVTQAILPQEAQAAFDAVMKDLLGQTYVPAALLGTKVIAGTEYAILCHAELVAEQPSGSYVAAYIAANADGSYNLMKVVPLNLADWNNAEE